MTPGSASARKIRVLINGLHARSGGGVTYLHNILPMLAEYPDLELHLFIHTDQFDIIGDVDERIRVHLLTLKPGIAYLLAWEQICLPILARLMRVDITFSPANYGPLFAPGSIILLRNALTVAGRETRPLKRLYWVALSCMTLLSLTASRHAIAVSGFALKTLTFGFARFLRRRLSVVYHGVGMIYSPGQVVTVDSPFLLAVADIYIQKNLHTLLKAMPLVLRSYPTLRLLIAGRQIDIGYYNELVKTIRRLNLESSIQFIDNVPPAELVELYRSCILFVFPSTVETFGNPLVEAMACGAPIACSTTAAMPEIVGDSAEFFDPFDSRSLAQTIVRLLQDPARREDLKRRGIERVRGFSWKESARQVAEIFRQCANRPAADGHLDSAR